MIHTLEADGIMLQFGDRRILSDIYLKCETGKISGVLGRNGQGKTCLMNIVYGSMQAFSRSVRFDGVFVPNAFKRPDLLTYMPQFNFIPSNLSLRRIFDDFELEYGDFERRFETYKSRYKMQIGRLSGGERRLIEVYAVIKSSSRFVMLDEPFSHLMPLQIEKIKELLVQEKSKKGFLITDHMFRQVTDICDSLYVLKDGKLHLTKSIEDIETLGYAWL